MVAQHGPALGVLRLDYEYAWIDGDIDSPNSFHYPVIYQNIRGLNFAMCQSGTFTPEVFKNVIEAVRQLESKGVSGITGNCGFMIHLQDFVAEHTHLPVFLSSLLQLPTIASAYRFGKRRGQVREKEIAVFSSNGKNLRKIESELRELIGEDPNDESSMVEIVGCEHVPGFEAVLNGTQVNCELVEAGVLALAKQVLARHPTIKCILLECTELPPYSNALRHELGIVVYDAVTHCNTFMAGVLGHDLFGRQLTYKVDKQENYQQLKVERETSGEKFCRGFVNDSSTAIEIQIETETDKKNMEKVNLTKNEDVRERVPSFASFFCDLICGKITLLKRRRSTTNPSSTV